MANWRCYSVKVTLASDLHCGDRPMGFISHTSCLVPQHVPLYALVPTIAARFGLPDKPETFTVLEEFLIRHLRFLPLLIMEENDNYLFPWNARDREVIEREFLWSKYGVALDYDTRGAMENRLFEIETISCRRRTGGGFVRLGGYMFCRAGEINMDSENIEAEISQGNFFIKGVPVSDLLQGSQLGGERNKGLGRLKEVDVQETDAIFQGIEPVLDRDHPEFTWPKHVPAPFILTCPESSKPAGVSGRLSPFTGRRFDPQRGPGLCLSKPIIGWQYGWKCDKDIRLKVNFDYCCSS